MLQVVGWDREDEPAAGVGNARGTSMADPRQMGAVAAGTACEMSGWRRIAAASVRACPYVATGPWRSSGTLRVAEDVIVRSEWSTKRIIAPNMRDCRCEHDHLSRGLDRAPAHASHG